MMEDLLRGILVADLIEDGRWKWFNCKNEDFENPKNILVPNLNAEVEDVVRWKTKEGNIVKYSTRQVWRDLNNSTQKVPWKALMWFSQCCPKHSFVMWIDVQRRLTTQDRLAKWKPNDTFTCSLCEKCPDSHDHLFFSFDFSKKVWTYFLQKIHYILPDIWASIMPAMIDLGFKNSIENIVRRLILGASVYMIWKERNTRLFQGKQQTKEVVIKHIEDNIKTSLMSQIVKDSVAVRKVEAIWNVKMIRKVTTVASVYRGVWL
ncbi:reverse transcriptase zinc-binding domain-containing protein [Tanacetum coccineum]